MVNEGSGRRRLEKQIELDASPEEVWELISTGPGMSAWFVPHTVDDSGEGTADFGGGQTQAGRVLAWEPGHRVVYGAAESASEQEPMALEFLVEGRAGGGTVLRLVQSGFLGEDWEAEYHSKGWDLFLHNLTSYLEHFAGLPVVNVVAMGFTTLDGEAVQEKIFRELGVDDEVSVGDRVDLHPAGTEPLAGVVDVRGPGALGIRTAHGFYRFMGNGSDSFGMVSAAHYFYGADIDGKARTATWQAWLDRLFPPSA